MTELKNCPLCGAKPIVRRFKDAVAIADCSEHETNGHTADELAALHWSELTKNDIYCPKCRYGIEVCDGYEQEDSVGEAIDIWNSLTKEGMLKEIEGRKEEYDRIMKNWQERKVNEQT